MIVYTEWIYSVASAEAIFEFIHNQKQFQFSVQILYARIMICYDASYLIW